MTKLTKSKVFDDVFTMEEINSLRQDQLGRDISLTYNQVDDKSLDYQDVYSVAHRIIKPKLDQLLGTDHEFQTGAYKDARFPYATHVDTQEYHKDHYNFACANRYYCAALIPLCQDPEFRTVLFDVHSDTSVGMGKELPDSYLDSSNDLPMSWFTHIKEPTRSQIPKLPLDRVYHWQLGGMIFWPRTQLHASTDFSKFGLCKKFVIIFVA